MDRDDWKKMNKGESAVPSTRKKKNKDDFDPNSDFIKEAMDDFTRSGGKIKIIADSLDLPVSFGQN